MPWMSLEGPGEPWEGCEQGRGRGSSGCRKTQGPCGDPWTIGGKAEDRRLDKGAGGVDKAYAGAWPMGTERKK